MSDMQATVRDTPTSELDGLPPELSVATPPPPPTLLVRLRPVLWIAALRVLVLVAFLGTWQLVASRGIVDPFFISSPTAVWDFLKETFTNGTVWPHLRATLSATLIAFTIGSIAGIVTGIILSAFPTLDAVIDPYLTLANALPRVALAPLFLLWFGLGMTSKVMLGISICYFILVLNARSGARSADEDLKTICVVMGATRLQTFRKLTLPSAVPAIFAGLRLSVVYALLGVVLGEMLAAQQGLGQRLQYYSGNFQVDGVMGILLVLAVMAAVGTWLVAQLERWILRWQ